MITGMTLVSPNTDQVAGQISISIEITSDNEPASFEDSFRVWLNDIELTDLTIINEPPWTITASPSLLGNQLVELKVEATDEDEAKSSVWTFSVEPEARLSDPQYYRAAQLPAHLAYYPEWTKARSNEYSVFAQFANPMALEFDKVKARLQNQNRALNLSKNLWNDPDWLYEYHLEVGEAFAKRLDSAGEEHYVAPSVWGIRGLNRLPLTGAEDFSLFWEGALPTRYEATSRGPLRAQLTASTSLGEVAGISDVRVPIPGFLYIWVHSIFGTVSIGDGLRVTDLVLRGENPEGLEQVEHIPLLRNDLFVTQKPWGKIYSVGTEGGPEGAEAEFVIYNLPPQGLSKEERMFKGPNGEAIKWVLESDLGGSVLDLHLIENRLAESIAPEQLSSFVKARYRLQDSAGTDVAVTDFAADPTSYLMYGINSSRIYIWDRRDVWPPSLAGLNGSSTSPEVDFHIMEYGDRVLADGLGGHVTSLTIELDAPKGSSRIEKWCWTVVPESGSRMQLQENSELVASEFPIWRYNSAPVQGFGINESTLTLDVEGLDSFIIELHLGFFGGSTEIVRKVWQGKRKIAIADYKVDHITPSEGSPLSVTVLEDGSITVYSAKESWIIKPQFDTFMPDFEGYRLLFRDEFDSIEVDFNEQ